MKISLSVFSYNFLSKQGTLLERIIMSKNINPDNIKSIFLELQKHGLDGIEMGLHNKFTDEDVESIKNTFLKLKIPILSVHQPIRLFSTASIEEIKSIFIAAKHLGAKIVVLHSDMAGKQLQDLSYKKTIKDLEKKYNITAAFENMQKHYLISPNPLYYNPKKFEQIMQKNNFSITLDTTHLGQVGGDIITFFKQNKNLIQNIHISDFKPHFFSSYSIFSKYRMHMSLGKGDLPIQEFLQTLRKEKYKGNITMEIPRSISEVIQSTKIIKQYIS